MGMSGGDKLKSYLERIGNNLGNDPSVDVGFFAGSTEHDSGLPSAYVALNNEYGTKTAPSRPFFRNMIAAGKKHWPADLGRALAAYQYDAENALNFIGRQMKEELQASIIAPGYVANADSTIEHKNGRDQTLIDTTDMYKNVEFKVKS